jgi:hypothetical protein
MRTTDGPMFDQRIADWLEDDPSTAPQEALDIIAAALISVPQRSGGWRLTRGQPALRFGFAMVVALVVVMATWNLLGAPSFGGPATPSPPTPTELVPTLAGPTPPFGLGGDVAPFGSPLYGYTLDRPVEWTVRTATRALQEVEPPWVDSPAVDYIAAFPLSSAQPGIILAAVDVADDRTLDEWTDLTAVATCGEPASRVPMTIDGEFGLRLEYPSCYALHHIWTTVIHDSRAYHIVWIGGRGSEEADRAHFDQVVATFRFPTTSPSTAPSSDEPRS